MPTASSMPTPTGDRGLYHTRNISNEYGTMCLPFPVKSGGNIHYYTFDSVTKDENSVTMKFTYLERVGAGIPALYHATMPELAADEPTDPPPLTPSFQGGEWYAMVRCWGDSC